VDDINECFLCGRNGNGDRLERHHIFGAFNRQKSEKYGLVVLLCGERCHRNGKLSAHKNAKIAKYLHQFGQRKVMQEQNWTVERFVLEFGKNYLEEEA
jgi:hypothetical protein